MENTEIKDQTAEVKPVPPTPVTQTETAQTAEAPADNQAEYNKKNVAAFVKMRQENREMKRKLAEVNAGKTTPPPVAAVATEQTEQVEQVVITPPTQVAAPAPRVAERNIEAESAKAIEALANDAQIVAVPGSILDIISMVDNDPRLADLHNIDPTIAFREAKNLWLEKTGIHTPPPIPKADTTPGGATVAVNDLEAMYKQLDTIPPGTAEWYKLHKQIREKSPN